VVTSQQKPKTEQQRQYRQYNSTNRTNEEVEPHRLGISCAHWDLVVTLLTLLPGDRGMSVDDASLLEGRAQLAVLCRDE
jgi:hypothetical protein